MRQSNDIGQRILELEEQRVQAFLEADTAVLERILAEDFTFTHTGSSVDSKQSFIQRLATSDLTYQYIATEDVQVRVYGNAAIVTGSMQNTLRGTQRCYGCVFMGVYAKPHRSWQMAALHATRLPDG